MRNINENIVFVNDNEDINELINKFKNKKKTIALCINKKKVVLGIITVGDLRRAISKYKDFKTKLSQIYNKLFLRLRHYPIHELSYRVAEFKKQHKKYKLNTIIILDRKKILLKQLMKIKFMMT